MKSRESGESRESGASVKTAGTSFQRPIVDFRKLDVLPGIGLDIGTTHIVSAAQTPSRETVTNIQRNTFLDVHTDTFTSQMLSKLGIDSFVPPADHEKTYVLGDPAFALANIFEKETRQPMKSGVISPHEPLSLFVVNMLVERMVGRPQKEGEPCVFSVPADPIDVDHSVIYHRGILDSLLRKLGYSPRPLIEGHAVVLAELQPEEFTGIGISCGGGMFNICVSYKAMPALTFSTTRGGDWIDENAAAALGMKASQVCAVKEAGMDIRHPKDRVQEAIAIYYRSLIQHTLQAIDRMFGSAQDMPSFSHPVPLVCSGGTSMVGGFIDVFREEFEKASFPLQVKEIRLARDPLTTVATGCLSAVASA